MKYRILTGTYQSSGFIAQVRVWGFWHNMFCGPMSDLPHEFSTIEEACKKIHDTHPLRSMKRAYIVKEIILP